jgi:hypothetical protein
VSAPFTVGSRSALRWATGDAFGDPQLFTHREDLLGDVVPGQAEWRARAHISTAVGRRRSSSGRADSAFAGLDPECVSGAATLFYARGQGSGALLGANRWRAAWRDTPSATAI